MTLWYKPLILAGALLPGALMAQPLALDYGTFYGHMKTQAKGDFGRARLGFYLMDPEKGEPCLAQSARIHSDNRDRPAVVAEDGGLLLPFDEQVYLDKGKVLLEMADRHGRCDLSVQVMAELAQAEDGAVTVADLLGAQGEMQALLDKMAGMIGKHFLPGQAGVRLTLTPASGHAYLRKGAQQLTLPWQGGSLTIDNQLLADFEGGTLVVAGRLVRLTPWLHKG